MRLTGHNASSHGGRYGGFSLTDVGQEGEEKAVPSHGEDDSRERKHGTQQTSVIIGAGWGLGGGHWKATITVKQDKKIKRSVLEDDIRGSGVGVGCVGWGGVWLSA